MLSSKSIELLRALTKEVKIQGAEIPFYHPDKEPYKYLGVLITPTLNWSYNLNTIREEMKFRAEKTVNCLLARHQKVQVQETNIKPYVSYSFPLGTLTEADLGQLDAMYARICKTIYRLPMSTPTAMVLEDKNKAGMGKVYQPLLELGLKDFRDLLARNRKATIMSSEELVNKYGKRAKPRHQIALNRLTLIVNSTHLNLDPSKWRTWNSRATLDFQDRVVRNPELFSDLAGTDTRSLHTPDLNKHAQKALDDLQHWRQARETRNRRMRRKPKRAQTQQTEVLVSNTTHRATVDSHDTGGSRTSPGCTDTGNAEHPRHTTKRDSTINERRACMKRQSSTFETPAYT